MTGSRGGRRLRDLKSKPLRPPLVCTGTLSMRRELAEIQGGGLALRAQEDGRVGDAVKARQKVGYVAGGRLVTAARAVFGWVLSLMQRAHAALLAANA